MNLSKFLKEVDNLSTNMSKDELLYFVHDMARTLPEEGRTNFLNRLESVQGQMEADGNGEEKKRKREKQEKEDIFQKCEDIKEKLECIENAELCLSSFMNEEYDDWYNSGADEFLFEDPEGIVGIIKDASNFVHQCIDKEEYNMAYEIAEILMELQITAEGDYADYVGEPLSMEELSHYWDSFDYKNLVIDAIYAAYCANELSERPDAVYQMIENSGRKDITLEMVLQSGEELPELKDFLRLWVEYLGQATFSNTQSLLKEALELADDPELLLKSARTYYIQHPALYEQYIQEYRGSVDDEKLLEVGEEALKAIDRNYLIRSRIALLISRIALEHEMKEEAEKCWLEAFRSDTNVVNYLRLFMECTDFSTVREAAKSTYQSMYHPKARKEDDPYMMYRREELRKNQPSVKTISMLAFLDGEFQYVKEHVMSKKESVGWSSTFMKCGLAAFLLLLLEDNNEPHVIAGVGCQEMCRRIVSEIGFELQEYQHGLKRKVEGNNEKWFLECFHHWKKTVSLSQEEKYGYIKWVEGLIEKRVNGIMEGNHRGYYGECAAYIAALGEVKESRGELNGKQKTLLDYKTRYSRRSAFHRELRAYGMADRKK